MESEVKVSTREDSVSSSRVQPHNQPVRSLIEPPMLGPGEKALIGFHSLLIRVLSIKKN